MARLNPAQGFSEAKGYEAEGMITFGKARSRFPSGAWTVPSPSPIQATPDLGTRFSLLALTKSRGPKITARLHPIRDRNQGFSAKLKIRGNPNTPQVRYLFDGFDQNLMDASVLDVPMYLGE